MLFIDVTEDERWNLLNCEVFILFGLSCVESHLHNSKWYTDKAKIYCLQYLYLTHYVATSINI